MGGAHRCHGARMASTNGRLPSALDTRAGPTGLADGIRMAYHEEANIAFNQINNNDGCGIAASVDSIVTGTDNYLGGNLAQALCGDLSLTLLSLNIP